MFEPWLLWSEALFVIPYVASSAHSQLSLAFNHVFSTIHTCTTGKKRHDLLMTVKNYTYTSSRKTWLLSGQRATGALAQHERNLDMQIVPISTINKNTGQTEDYWIIKGYYVPCYGLSQNTPGNKRAAVMEQKRRFFYFAEQGIDVVDTHQDIMKDHQQWLTLNQATDKSSSSPVHDEDKRALGALVVGAMVNRAARIEQALATNHAGGLGLDDVVETPRSLSERDIATLKKELSTYANILVPNKDNIIGCVHRNNHKPDVNGVLHEIARETLKAYAQKTDMVERDAIHKIADTMVAIDEAAKCSKNIIEKLQKQPAIKSILAVNSPQLSHQFKDFFDTTRARSGIKSSDPHYSEIFMECSSVEKLLFTTLSKLREASRGYEGRGKATLAQGVKLLTDAAEIASDMAKARYPMNATAFPSISIAEREPTSVERLQESTSRWLQSGRSVGA